MNGQLEILVFLFMKGTHGKIQKRKQDTEKQCVKIEVRTKARSCYQHAGFSGLQHTSKEVIDGHGYK
jgi:hypothetical protein